MGKGRVWEQYPNRVPPLVDSRLEFLLAPALDISLTSSSTRVSLVWKDRSMTPPHFWMCLKAWRKGCFLGHTVRTPWDRIIAAVNRTGDKSSMPL